MSADAGVVRDVEPAPGKAGLWEDFVDIFYAPSTVFARRSDGKWGVPLLFLIIACTALFFLTRNALSGVMDAEFTRQSAAALRKNPNLTQEQLSSGRSFFENFAPIFFAVGLTISVILTGVALWAVGKLFDAKESVAAALMVATYSEAPRLVQVLTNAAQGLFMPAEKLTSINSVSFSLARFLDPDQTSAIMIALASRVDVFTIWITVLLAIGLSVVGKIPRQQAAIAAGIVWLLGALPAMLGALRA
jgi:hypothetical protein